MFAALCVIRNMIGYGFWIIVAALIIGVLQSYSVYQRRIFPTVIVAICASTFYAMEVYNIGPIGISIIAVSALVVWIKNVYIEKA